MIQLDLIGTLIMSGLWLASQAVGVEIELAVIVVVAASFAWVHIRDWMAHQQRLEELQERIDQLWTKR